MNKLGGEKNVINRWNVMDEIVKQNLFEVSPSIMQQYKTLFILIFADMTANIPTKEVEIL